MEELVLPSDMIVETLDEAVEFSEEPDYETSTEICPNIQCCGVEFTSYFDLLNDHARHAHPRLLRDAFLEMKDLILGTIKTGSISRSPSPDQVVEEVLVDGQEISEEQFDEIIEVDNETTIQEDDCETHEEEEPADLTCKRCVFIADSKSELNLHQREYHWTKQKHVCYICEAVNWSKFALLQHMLEKHIDECDFEVPSFIFTQSQVVVYPCSECNQNFQTPELLREHKASHEAESPSVCSFCRVTFKQKRSYHQHLSRYHSSSKKADHHQCPECKSVFSTEYHLRTHLGNVHGKGTAFTCEECGKGFARLYEYNSHMTKHSTDFPISCPDCGKTFKREQSLKLHRRNIHEALEADRESCILCKGVFKNKDFLRGHIRKVHKMSMLQAFQAAGRPYKGRAMWNAIERKQEIVVNNKTFKVGQVLE